MFLRNKEQRIKIKDIPFEFGTPTARINKAGLNKNRLRGRGNKEVSLKAETSDVICVRKNTFKYLFTCVRDPSRGSNSFELVNICKRCCREIVRFPNFRSPLFSFCFVYSVICYDGYKLERSFFERCFFPFFLFSRHFAYCLPDLKRHCERVRPRNFCHHSHFTTKQ